MATPLGALHAPRAGRSVPALLRVSGAVRRGSGRRCAARRPARALDPHQGDRRPFGGRVHDAEPPDASGELEQQAARNRARSYRPAEDLDPEFEGLPLDPDPVPGAPFLFTIAGLAEEVDAGIPALPPLSDEAKAALRQEVGLADDYANMVGREVCTILLHHRLRIQSAVGQYVEPQIEALLEELTRSLDAPFDPNEPPQP